MKAAEKSLTATPSTQTFWTWWKFLRYFRGPPPPTCNEWKCRLSRPQRPQRRFVVICRGTCRTHKPSSSARKKNVHLIEFETWQFPRARTVLGSANCHGSQPILAAIWIMTFVAHDFILCVCCWVISSLVITCYNKSKIEKWIIIEYNFETLLDKECRAWRRFCFWWRCTCQLSYFYWSVPP